MRPKGKPAPQPRETFAELLKAQPHRATPPIDSPEAKVEHASPRGTPNSVELNADAAPLILSQDDDQFHASAPGTSLKSLQELQRGRHSPQITLDAHGMTVAKASAALDATLQKALDSGLRTVLVIHGRGHNSGSAGSVLRNAVLDHLTRLRAGVILQLCSAPPKWGGAGATLVRLRQPRR